MTAERSRVSGVEEQPDVRRRESKTENYALDIIYYGRTHRCEIPIQSSPRGVAFLAEIRPFACDSLPSKGHRPTGSRRKRAAAAQP